MIARVLALCALLSVLLVTDQAHAGIFFGPRSEYSPSVFDYGWRGLSVGALGGLSGGYLVARRDGAQGGDWRPLVLGTGIGALSGAALGLVLGFSDLADNRPGVGNIVLRDMLYGSVFGAVAGMIVGGLVVIRTHHAENVAFGAAVGTLSGIGAGLVFGLIEGRRIVDSPQHRYSGKGVAPTLFALEDVRQQRVWGAGALGRF